MNFFLLALKNLSRHPSHTILKATGIGAATAAIALWGMLTGGFADQLQRTATRVELGLVQLHQKSYLEMANLYDTVVLAADQAMELEQAGIYAAPRFFGYALVGAGDQSVGVRVRGIAPSAEKNITSIDSHLSVGTWLTDLDQNAVIIGSDLAQSLTASVGSELVLVGQAADGSLANDLFRVKGILKTINQEFDRRTVIVSETSFRSFFVSEQGAQELAFSAKMNSDIGENPGAIKVLLEKVLEKNSRQSVGTLKLQTWREIKPALARTLDMLKVTSLFSLIFTYIALGCLVVNSIMMMVYDRMREYGVMKAMGTEPRTIVQLILSEAWWLGLIAGGIAVVLTAPVAWYWHQNGLDLSFYVERVSFGGFVIEPRIYASLGVRQIFLPLIFLLITMPLAALYPALKAAKIEPIEALNSQL